MTKLFLTSVLTVIVALRVFAVQTETGPITNSQKYESFNVDSRERTQFALSQNGRVNSRLKKSSSRKNLEAFLRKKYEAESIIVRSEVSNGSILVVDRGLNKAQELIFKSADGMSQTLFSTFQLSKNNRYRIANLRLSPKNGKVLLSLRLDGSRDDSYFKIIDLNSKKTMQQQFFCHCNATSFYWKSEDELLFKDMNVSGNSVIKSMVFNGEETSVSEVYSGYVINTVMPTIMILTSTKEDHNIILSHNEPPLEIDGIAELQFENFYENFIYFTKSDYIGSVSTTELYRLDRETAKLTLMKSFTGNLTLNFVLEEGFAFLETKGYNTTVNYYNFSTDSLIMLDLPNFVSLTMVSETENSKKLVLSFASDLIDDKEVLWNIETNTADLGDSLKKEMLESNELSLDVTFKMIRSFDGTEVPIKMVSKKGIILSRVPVYMEVYGGFSSPGSLAPEKNVEILEFVKRGGLFVAPALRGGNELGEAWHEAAMKENKIKTYEDLAATAKYLIDSGISEKNKIAIAGTSNGGLTVAATGLLFPQYFGLVIPTNGVLDLLAKQTLDARFGGWRHEYGDARKAEEAGYLSKISPLELVANAENGPAFLIVNGRHDSRVNAAHSIKFAKAAEDLKAAGKNINVELIALNNSGHPVSAPENDYIAIRSLLAIWSRVYDDFGMSF